MHESINLIGYGSDIAGASKGSGEGAAQIKNSRELHALLETPIELNWLGILKPNSLLRQKDKIVQELCLKIALLTAQSVLEKKFFIVLGGDHTSAIGTWSGVYHAMHAKGPLGLIWIDAHLDSHTPETSKSGNLHGMPLAVLLGYGNPNLTEIMSRNAKLQPDNVCIIGARSYEEDELRFLQSLNVKIFFMEEIKHRGLSLVLHDAVSHVTKNTVGYGVSIDIDSIDPHDAPGTGVAEKNGIAGSDLCHGLISLADDKRLLGAEIVEFDPHRDQNAKTEKLIVKMMSALSRGKVNE